MEITKVIKDSWVIDLRDKDVNAPPNDEPTCDCDPTDTNLPNPPLCPEKYKNKDGSNVRFLFGDNDGWSYNKPLP